MGTRTCCEHFSVIHLLRNIETVEILLLELPALDTSRVPQLTQQQRPGSWKGLDPFVVVVVVFGLSPTIRSVAKGNEWSRPMKSASPVLSVVRCASVP